MPRPLLCLLLSSRKVRRLAWPALLRLRSCPDPTAIRQDGLAFGRNGICLQSCRKSTLLPSHLSTLSRYLLPFAAAVPGPTGPRPPCFYRQFAGKSPGILRAFSSIPWCCPAARTLLRALSRLEPFRQCAQSRDKSL